MREEELVGVKERGGCWVESSRQGSKKDTVKYVAVSRSAVSVFLLESSCRPTISMQRFEVGEMYIVGRPTGFFPYECDTFYPL